MPTRPVTNRRPPLTLLLDGLTGATDLYPGDNGNDGGENDIYIGPDLWTNDTAEISCDPPCTLILPPFPLATPVSITWPAYETTLASSAADGATVTITTTISIAPFEISEIPFWPITITSSGQGAAYFSPTQSIAPPSTLLTLAGTEATFPLYHTDYSASLGSGATATSGATSVSTPAAVQTGIASDCTEFYQASSGDTCYDIAQEHDITLDEFYVCPCLLIHSLRSETKYLMFVEMEPSRRNRLLGALA